MSKITAVSFLSIIATCIILSCSSVSNPAIPEHDVNFPRTQTSGWSDVHLWGLYDVYLDLENQKVEAVLVRTANFTANVVNFLNNSAAGLSFKINNVIDDSGYVDVDIDVSITHPFPGLPQYNGYDVRGIFMGNGSGSLVAEGGKYPLPNIDQFMLPDPLDGFGGPDGYSRWFNKAEFSGPGMPLFTYTQGKMASPGFNGTATICPYKYFADGLGATENVWTFLVNNSSQNGRFSSGVKNTRNYYLRFPDSLGIKYGYAVIANWEGESIHPSNAPEAVACRVTDTSDLWFIDSSSKGGSIKLDFSLFNWGNQPTNIIIESTVLSSPYQLSSSEMIPIGGDKNYSTWHVEIAADNLNSSTGNEYWIIAKYDDFTYANEFGVPNAVQDKNLCAYFRYELSVNTNILPPVCNVQIDAESPSMPFEGWGTFGFDASASYDPAGGSLTFSWDFNDDGNFGDSYNSGTPEHPKKVFDFVNQTKVCVKVTNEMGLSSKCCVAVDIKPKQTKNIPLRTGVKAKDIAINPTNGDLLVSYDDLRIYKYTRSSFYQSGSQFIHLNIFYPKPDGPMFLEVNSNQYTYIVSTQGTTYTAPGSWIYTPQGSYLSNSYIGYAGLEMPNDAVAFVAGSFAEHMGIVKGEPYSSPPNTYILQMRRQWEPDWAVGTGNWHSHYCYPPAPYSGYNKMNPLCVIAAEADISGNFVWFIKNKDTANNPDCWASRWAVSSNTLTFDNAYFGTGSQTDSNNGWNEAKDLTFNKKGRLCVLDKLSTGEPRVKAWTISGNTVTSVGHFGDSTTISGAPLRIEGSRYENIIVVLHGETSPQMISVFLDGEMP